MNNLLVKILCVLFATLMGVSMAYATEGCETQDECSYFSNGGDFQFSFTTEDNAFGGAVGDDFQRSETGSQSWASFNTNNKAEFNGNIGGTAGADAEAGSSDDAGLGSQSAAGVNVLQKMSGVYDGVHYDGDGCGSDGVNCGYLTFDSTLSGAVDGYGVGLGQKTETYNRSQIEGYQELVNKNLLAGVSASGQSGATALSHGDANTPAVSQTSTGLKIDANWQGMLEGATPPDDN